MKPLRIAYLLEDTGLSGGARVAVAQADALTDRGHEATVVAKGPPLAWRESHSRWRYVHAFDEIDPSAFDFIVGTFWTTLAATHRLGGERAIHLCQGYEGSFTAYQPFKSDIDAAYRLPLPKMVVSPHLIPICQEFYPDVTCVGQIVDEIFFRGPVFRERQPLRVLLAGPAQADFKGVDVGYEAVLRARNAGAVFDLIRVSQWQPAEGEPVDLAAEFHVGIGSTDMSELIASCDVFLGPSRYQEGFGLPAAESMASGLACVLSAIPSFRSFDASHDYALFSPEGEAEAMATHLARLIADAGVRRAVALRAREVAEQFRAARTGARLVDFFSARARTHTSGR